MMAVPKRRRIIRNPPDAATWIIRGRVAADLGTPPATVTRCSPGNSQGEAEAGAVGELLHVPPSSTGIADPDATGFQRRSSR